MKFTSYSFTFIFVFCFVLLLCTALQAELVRNYDSDAEMTIINTEPTQVMNLNPRRQPRLSITIQHRGQNPPSPAELAELVVNMSFISLSRNRRFDDCREIQCFVNGSQVFRKEFEQQTDTMRRSVMETLTINVPYAEFERMIDANQLEFRICEIELELHEIERQDIRQVRRLLR